MPRFKNVRVLMASTLALLVAACGSSSNNDTTTTPVESTFKLQLIHSADMEGDGTAVTEAPRWSAIIQHFQQQYPDNTLTLSSGDNYIPSPWFSAANDDAFSLTTVGTPNDGRADIQIMNEVGIQASCVGNHEMDTGPAGFASLINPDASYLGARFPYLSCNLDFSTEPELSGLVAADGQPASTIPNSLAKSCTIMVNGETIGIVGATTPTQEDITSVGGTTVNPASDSTADLAVIIQAEVDNLTAQGINKIILLAHMQTLTVERTLATLLTNVDIIVGGGSDTILADANDRLRTGDTAADTYPVWFTNPDNEPVALVNTDGQFRYVGRLCIEFDSAGVLIESSYDEDESGAYATDAQGVMDLGNPPADPEVNAIATVAGIVLLEREGNIFGNASVFLNGERAGVRTEETNMGNLTSDANLEYAQSIDADVVGSIKNGGGIRRHIGEIVQPPGTTDPNLAQRLPNQPIPIAGKQEGDISQLDIQNTLAFNNNLEIVTITAQELIDTLEHTVNDWPNQAGRFPQIAGIRFSFDGNAVAGSRLINVVVLDDNGANVGGAVDVVLQNGVLQGSGTRTFKIVTLGFLAGGGDGYPWVPSVRTDLDTGTTGDAATFADTGTEQDVLAEYLLANFPNNTMPYSTADTDANLDQRIQNVAVPGTTDTVLTNP